MPDYYPKSRLSQKRLKNAYKRIFLALSLSIVLVLAVIYLGIPALVNVSEFLGNLRSFDTQTTKDTTPPFPPRLEPLSKATNNNTVSLKGFSEPGSTIEVILNGSTFKKILTSKDGNFETSIILDEGENRIITQAIDGAKNTSLPSETIFITFEKEGPKLEISQPENNSKIKSEERVINVIGKTNPEATVLVNGRYAILNNDGSFSHRVSLQNGDNTIEVIARDNAGNEKKININVNFSP